MNWLDIGMHVFAALALMVVAVIPKPSGNLVLFGVGANALIWPGREALQHGGFDWSLQTTAEALVPVLVAALAGAGWWAWRRARDNSPH